MIKFSRAALGAALLVVTGLAAANTTTTVDVDALTNSIEVGYGGTTVAPTGAATGVFLQAGQTFTAVVESGPGSNTQWQNDPDSFYLTTADGGSFGDWSEGAATFAIGSLVGRIGTGDFFKVGSDFWGHANASGTLELFYWDSDAWNNSGTLKVDVTAVPEPANIALMGLALGAFALSRRRKA
jgi:hypothetical protein